MRTAYGEQAMMHLAPPRRAIGGGVLLPLAAAVCLLAGAPAARSAETALSFSGNGSTGTLVNAEWVTLASLDLLTAEGFLNAMPFTLANIETGSERFTNSNTVSLVACPIPDGYDHVQFTLEGSPDALEPDAWQPTNALPATLDFPRPATDTNRVLYAWFTNRAESVTLRRATGQIRFTTNPPLPAVQVSLARQLIDGFFVRVYPGAVDAGSLGGESLGDTIAVHSLSLNLESGPDTNATPRQPFITVANTGTYNLSLTVVNEAGNVATSSVSTLSVTPSDGHFVWAGHSDDDWFTPENWEPVGLPSAGQTVRVGPGAAVRLTNSTPVLSELVLTNATVTMANWSTALRADAVLIARGGRLTLPGAFTDAEMSNRVWVVCNDFTLAEEGEIDVDGHGYGGGYGPSNAGTGSRTSGGGYGGRGACNPLWGDSRYGLAYGTPAGPLQPGSGGCSTSLGGAGGGLVQIEAADTIAIHGAIRADGLTGLPSRYNGPGGGSGGGVYLACREFTGSGSGSITVRGGIGVKEKVTDAAPRGGGGRVAIHYEQASPWPPISIDADVGASGAVTEPHGETLSAGWGSLYVSDDSLLRGLNVLNATTFPVRHVALWINGFSQWQVASLSVSNAAFRWGDTNVALRIADELMIGSGGRLGATRIEAGSVLLADGGSLDIRAGAAASPEAWGGELRVAGTLAIGADSTLRLFADSESGAVPRVRAHEVHVAAGGLIDASAKGHRSSGGAGAGNVSGSRSGGGYGGQGGSGKTADPAGGQPYGSPAGPLLAGSGGCYYGRGGDGGGLVHIEASGTITLNGTITAQGGHALDGYSNGTAGGGAGGGILLAGRKLTGSGLLSVRGGDGRTYAGGGGGGRIALWTGVPPEHFGAIWQRLLATGQAPEAMTSTNALPATFDGTFETNVELAGGTGGTGSAAGQPGTYRWIAAKAGLVFVVR